MILADTDVLIDFLNGRGALNERVAFEIERSWLGTTAITAFELAVGASSERKRLAVEDLLAALPVLPLSRDAAVQAAEIFRRLAREGRPIGMADCLIAGACMEAGAALLTRNKAHFERIEGLKLSMSAV